MKRVWTGAGIVSLILALMAIDSIRETEADAYQIIGERVLSVVDLLQVSPSAAGHRVYIINGQVVNALLSHTNASPGQVLDNAQIWLQRRPQDILEVSAVPRLAAMEAPRAPLSRFGGEGWGAVVQLSPALAFPKSERATAAVAEQTSAGVIILATERGDATEVWTLYLDQDFDLLALLAGPTQRSGILQAVGIGGVPGTDMVLEFTELTDFYRSHIIAFEGPGTVESHLAHFQHVIEQHMPQHTAKLSRGRDDALLYVQHQGIDLTVYISPAGSGAVGMTDVIQIKVPN